MPRRPFAAVGWAHAVTAVIEDATRQQSVSTCAGRSVAVALLRQLSLGGLEQVSIEDRRMPGSVTSTPPLHAGVPPNTQPAGLLAMVGIDV